MKGVYINTKVDDSPLITLGKEYSLKLTSLSLGNNCITICSDDNIDAVTSHDNYFFVLSGWAYDGKLVNAEELSYLYLNDELGKIRAGNFVFLVFEKPNQNLKVVTDPFGLSTHYYRINSGKLELAPTTSAFSDKSLDKVWFSFEQQHGHLVGNHTRYENIKRLPPASEMDNVGNIARYWSVSKVAPDELKNVRKEFRNLISSWPVEERVIPLSGGFDSRLIASCGQFRFGYTYGEKNSDDRKIGKKITNSCVEYLQFSQPCNDEVANSINNYLFDGKILNLIGTYQKTFLTLRQKQSEKSKLTVFDGHLGDGLQRGSYLKLGGVVGVIFLLFPWLYNLPLSSRFLLKRRYKGLDDYNFNLLVTEFNNETNGLDFDNLQKVVYFEAMFGRGGRFIVNGGNIAASQFFTVVSPFANTEVFQTLLSQDFRRVVSYKNMKVLWEGADNVFLETPTETGIKPSGSHILAPFLRVVNAIRQNMLTSAK